MNAFCVQGKTLSVLVVLYLTFAVITDRDHHSVPDLLRSLTPHSLLYRQRSTNDSFRFVIIASLHMGILLGHVNMRIIFLNNGNF